MVEEAYAHRELEAIDLIMKLDNELHEFKRIDKELRAFIEKIDEKLQSSKRVIKKRVKKTSAYQLTKSILQNNSQFFLRVHKNCRSII